MSKDAELDVYGRQGFGGSLGLTGRTGLLIIDFMNGFADPDCFGGGNIRPAIEATVPVLATARAKAWPIAHSRIVFAADGSDANIFSLKVRGMDRLTEGSPLSAIVDELQPFGGELVLRKTSPSAFFGTNLAAWFAQRGVATLVVAGCTTSGCVRASVVDAMSSGFRPVVLADCVGDRADGPHLASLFDMGQKYADVLSWAEVQAALAPQAA